MSFLKQSGRVSVLNSVVMHYHRDIIKNTYFAELGDMQLPGNILCTLRTYNNAHDLCSAAVVSPDADTIVPNVDSYRVNHHVAIPIMLSLFFGLPAPSISCKPIFKPTA